MGAVGLHLIEKYGHAELGYWLGKPYRRRGYISEAVGALITAGFEHLPDLARIQAIHKLDNDASGGALLANGLTREATLDDYVIKDGMSQTVVSYRILRREWAAGRTQDADKK
ncbi:GNAT family N-acetyltransferase [Neolewinella sp.]|uniref:GNAT family N-acetyltransferase n=1 Tax=Neolewinella sp. TaxID=2993543 RepID=UPI003B51805F